jgi:hypothetical protein
MIIHHHHQVSSEEQGKREDSVIDPTANKGVHRKE